MRSLFLLGPLPRSTYRIMRFVSEMFARVPLGAGPGNVGFQMHCFEHRTSFARIHMVQAVDVQVALGLKVSCLNKIMNCHL